MLDGRLPDGDGLELCEEIRASRPEAPIIILSASVEQDQVKRALESGATAHLGKPLDLERLGDTIKELHRRSIATKPPTS